MMVIFFNLWDFSEITINLSNFLRIFKYIGTKILKIIIAVIDLRALNGHFSNNKILVQFPRVFLLNNQ